jgi:transcriptional regulator with XRE-family HTH domain
MNEKDAPRPENRFVARQLAKAIRECGLTQEEFSRAAGIPYGTLTKWLTARRHPPRVKLLKVAEITGKPVSFFTDQDGADQVNEAIVSGLFEVFQLLMQGEDLAAAVDRVSGDPTLMDHDRRRQISALGPALRHHIQRRAPRAWDQLDDASRRELLAALAALARPPLAEPNGEA